MSLFLLKQVILQYRHYIFVTFSISKQVVKIHVQKWMRRKKGKKTDSPNPTIIIFNRSMTIGKELDD